MGGFLAAMLQLTFQVNGQMNNGLLPAADTVILWQGFQLHWTYNHRLNRMGSYVRPANGAFQIVKTGATGIGRDSGHFITQWAALASRHAAFHHLRDTLRLRGKEGDLIHAEKTIALPSTHPMMQKGVALLNGFDLVSMKKADKLTYLKITVDTPQFFSGKDSIRIRISAAVRMNCRSLECAFFNQEVDYRLMVDVLLVEGDENLAAAYHETGTRYQWDKKEELITAPVEVAIGGISEKRFAVGVTGWRSLEITLDKSHWLVDWSSLLTNPAYDAATGRWRGRLHWSVKQWREGMQRDSYSRQSLLSKAQPGRAALKAGLVLLQFKSGCVERGSRAGSIVWKGGNRSALSREAVRQETIRPVIHCD